MKIVEINVSHDGAPCFAAAPEVPIIHADHDGDISHVVDRLLAMRRQEDSDAYRIEDYLPSSAAAAAPRVARVDIDGECRAKMADWFYQLVDFCRVERDNVAVAMSYLDRFLSTYRSNPRARRCIEDRRDYQLAALTCLYLAVNLHETRQMDTALLVELSHGKYARSDFVSMARDITFGLGWRLNGPTAMGFVNHLLGLLPAAGARACKCREHRHHHSRQEAESYSVAATLHELCRMQTELAASDHRLSAFRPSEIAVASIRNAMEEVHPDHLSRVDRLRYFRSLDEVDVRPFSAEAEEISAILKMSFRSSVDGLRQVTSLLRLGEHCDDDDGEEDHEDDGDSRDIQDVCKSSKRDSARCVAEIAAIQERDRIRRGINAESATP